MNREKIRLIVFFKKKLYSPEMTLKSSAPRRILGVNIWNDKRVKRDVWPNYAIFCVTQVHNVFS